MNNLSASRNDQKILSLGAWTWLMGLVVIPLSYVLILSLLSRGTYGGVIFDFTMANYSKLFHLEYGVVVLRVLLRSLVLATFTTILCMLVGYPLALFLVYRAGRLRPFLFMILIIPFWTNFLIRTYAWFALLSDNGWLITVVRAMGLDLDSLGILFTSKAVYLGMLYNYLPFMAMTLYLNLEKIDVRLIEAAGDLGANRLTRFCRVILPLSLPGLAAGSILVFIPALGEFVIPDILGGSTEVYVGNLLAQQFLNSRNWPFGAAISVVLLILILLAFALFRWLQKDKMDEVLL